MFYKILVLDLFSFEYEFVRLNFSYRSLFSKNFLNFVFNNIVEFIIVEKINKNKIISNVRRVRNSKIYNKIKINSFLILNGFLTNYKLPCSGRVNIIYYSSILNKLINSVIGGKTGPVLSNFIFNGIFFYNSKQINIDDLILNKSDLLKKEYLKKNIVFFKNGFSINYLNSSSVEICDKYSKFLFDKSNCSFFISPLKKLEKYHLKNWKFIRKILLFGIKNEKGRFAGKFGLGNLFIDNGIYKIYFVNNKINIFYKLVSEKKEKIIKENNDNLRVDFKDIIEFKENIKLINLDKFNDNSVHKDIWFKDVKKNSGKKITVNLKKSKNAKYEDSRNLMYNKYDKLKKYLIKTVNISNDYFKGFYKFNKISDKIIYNKKYDYIEKNLEKLIGNMNYCPGYCIKFKMDRNKNLYDTKYNGMNGKSSNKEKFNKEKFDNIKVKDLKEFIDINIMSVILSFYPDLKFKNYNKIIFKKFRKAIYKFYKSKDNELPVKIRDVLSYIKIFYGTKSLFFKIYKLFFIIKYKRKIRILNNLGICAFTIFSIKFKRLKRFLASK